MKNPFFSPEDKSKQLKKTHTNLKHKRSLTPKSQTGPFRTRETQIENHKIDSEINHADGSIYLFGKVRATIEFHSPTSETSFCESIYQQVRCC